MKNLILFAASFVFLNSCNNAAQGPTASTPSQQEIAKAKTVENMKAAWQGEKTATAKYEACSVKAEQESLHYVALLYSALSAAENIHAMNHKAVIEDAGGTVTEVKPSFTVKTTKENLHDDIDREAYEAKNKYPDFLKTAELADNEPALLSLNYAMKTERKHKTFFEIALGDINSNTLGSLPVRYFVCPACGNTYIVLPKHCDFSLTEGNTFIKFE
jgi:rubrerythrin